jgi:hypothetical protein
VNGPRPRAWLVGSTLACVCNAAGCAPRSVPDPRSAIGAYATAAARGDPEAIYGLLTDASRRAYSQEQIRAMVSDERPELAEQARNLGRGEVRIEASARLRFSDGEEATLDLRGGSYGVTSAGALPGGGRTPQETLAQLRRALARRSYEGLVRVLSTATRSAMENDIRDLVEGLSDPAELLVPVSGDEARVPIPGGHMVTLKREAGIWRVQNFD